MEGLMVGGFSAYPAKWWFERDGLPSNAAKAKLGLVNNPERLALLAHTAPQLTLPLTPVLRAGRVSVGTSSTTTPWTILMCCWPQYSGSSFRSMYTLQLSVSLAHFHDEQIL